MIRRTLALALAVALAATPLYAEDPPSKVPEVAPEGLITWYAQALAQSPAGLNVTHFWSKGASLRAETVVAGHKIVTIVRGDHYTTYDALLGRGVVIKRAPAAIAAAAAGRRPFGNELPMLLAQGAEKVREEALFGVDCDVFRITDGHGRRELWITHKARLPLRIAVFDRRRSANMSTDYLNWQRGLAIEDAFFDPDPGVELAEYEIEEYFATSGKVGAVGPVPILYSDLLRGSPK